MVSSSNNLETISLWAWNTNDTVEVGADLYVIDTEGVATVETSASSGAVSATQP